MNGFRATKLMSFDCCYSALFRIYYIRFRTFEKFIEIVCKAWHLLNVKIDITEYYRIIIKIVETTKRVENLIRIIVSNRPFGIAPFQFNDSIEKSISHASEIGSLTIFNVIMILENRELVDLTGRSKRKWHGSKTGIRALCLSLDAPRIYSYVAITTYSLAIYWGRSWLIRFR